MPVRHSTFTSLWKRHEMLNVEVALGEIPTFRGGTTRHPTSRLLYADIQTNADENNVRRLGSGRSGLYRGHYLKGVGRTLLAGNWNHPAADLYHSSGVMFASSAIREYVVSAFLEARGAAGLINPCTGVLVRPLSTELRDVCRRSFGHGTRATEGRLDVSPADRSLQAITVKPDMPPRFSNFTWWLCNYPQIFRPGVSAVAEFFSSFSGSLSGASLDSGGLDGETIIRQLFATIDGTLANFVQTWSNGVCWGSFHNNFSTDGRFLDLETPLILPSPIVGALADATVFTQPEVTLKESAELICFQGVAQYLMQMKVFCAFMRMQLGFIIVHQHCTAREAEFIESVLAALEQHLSSETVLTSLRALEASVLPMIRVRLSGGTKHDAVLRTLLREACWRARLYRGLRRPQPTRASTLFRVKPPFDLARPEPVVQMCIYVPDFLRDHYARTCEAASMAANQAIRQADALSDPETLLSFLATVPSVLQRARQGASASPGSSR